MVSVLYTFYTRYPHASLFYSAQYMLNVMDVKNTGISLMNALSSSDQKQVTQLLKQQGALLSPNKYLVITL